MINDRTNFQQPHNNRGSLQKQDRSQAHIKNLKSQMVSFKDSISNNTNDYICETNLQENHGASTARPHLVTSNDSANRVYTEDNLSNNIRSTSVRSNGINGIKPVEPYHNTMGARRQTTQKETNRALSRTSYQGNSPSRNFQFKGVTNHNQRTSQGYNQQPVDPNDMNQRLRRAEQKIREQHQQFLKKCLQVQKSKAYISQIEGQKQMMLKDIEKYQKDIENIKKSNSNMSKLLNDSRLKVINLEGQRKQLLCKLDDEEAKYNQLTRQKQSLEKQIENFKQIKQFMEQFQQTQQDKKQQIKNNIAYELRIIQLNRETQKNLGLSVGDLKQAQQIHNTITQDISELEKEINSKIKEISQEKSKLEKQLEEARQQTQKIRKSLHTSYQQQISDLKNQIVELKEENMVLNENCQSKITIIKLERQIAVLESKNKSLMQRYQENEEIVEKLKNGGNLSLTKTTSEVSSQKSAKAVGYYDNQGQTDLSSIIRKYEIHDSELNSRINEKQANELVLKQKIEQLEQECQQLKSTIKVKSRKQRSITQSSMNQVQSIKLQLKNEKQSLECKVKSMESNIKRKNKEIKEKDQFITQYLLNKLKNEQDVTNITENIKTYFEQKQNIQ